jgi:hypothetical protein
MSDHFKADEVACRCGCGFGGDATDGPFFQFMELTRAVNGGRPLMVRSWHRCEKQNALWGGVENSAHTRGVAADIRVRGGGERVEIVVAAILAKLVMMGNITENQAVIWAEELRTENLGIGVARTFVHLDVDTSLPRPSIWSY